MISKNRWLLTTLFLLSSQSFAEITVSKIHDPDLSSKGLSFYQDDKTGDQDLKQMRLTQLQLHQAEVWGLTEEEEKRYVALMQNRSATYYEGLRLTPIDILGLNARSHEERQHFASIAAKQEAQKVAQNLAWNLAFYHAYNKVFKDIPVIGDFDPSPYSPYAYKPIPLIAGDTLYLFVKTNEPIKTVLMVLCDVIKKTPNTKLNLMLLQTDNLGIQLWANIHQIPQELVIDGQITLNQGDLNFESLKIDKKSSPLLLLSRNGHSQRVDLGRF